MNAWSMHLGLSACRQVLAACGLVALSGVLWMVLGAFVDTEDYTDPLRAWRHRLLALHGVAAYLLLWIAGRLYALHQQGNWRVERNRASGMALSAVLLLLAGSGLTLYYPPHGDGHDVSSLLHQGLGMALLLLLPLHVRLARQLRRRRRAREAAVQKSSW